MRDSERVVASLRLDRLTSVLLVIGVTATANEWKEMVNHKTNIREQSIMMREMSFGIRALGLGTASEDV